MFTAEYLRRNSETITDWKTPKDLGAKPDRLAGGYPATPTVAKLSVNLINLINLING